MIKKGDKLFCIKTIRHYATGEIRFNVGSCYDVMDNRGGEIWLIPEDEDRECYIHGDRTNRFLTLAEWRDKQINTILDEEN
jgi:hypothetical protein